MESQIENFSTSSNPSLDELVYPCVPLSSSSGLSLRAAFLAHCDRTSLERQNYYSRRRGNNRTIGRTRNGRSRGQNSDADQLSSAATRSRTCIIRVGIVRLGKNGKIILKQKSTVEVLVHSRDSVETLLKKSVEKMYGSEKLVPIANFFVYCQNPIEKSLQYRTILSLNGVTLASNLDDVCGAIKKECSRICFRILEVCREKIKIEEGEVDGPASETNEANNENNNSTDNSVEYSILEEGPGSSANATSTTPPVVLSSGINNPPTCDFTNLNEDSNSNFIAPMTLSSDGGFDGDIPLHLNVVEGISASLTAQLDRETEDSTHSGSVVLLDTESEEIEQQIVENWRNKTLNIEQVNLDIHRKRLIPSLHVNFALRNFSFYKEPVVKFFNEDGQDGGGLRRELFSLLMEHLGTKSPLFEKSKRLCFLSNNVELDEKQAYFEAGRFVAWSVLHGGRGLNVMSPECLSFMRNEKPNVLKWLKALPEGELKCAIIKLRGSDENNWHRVIREAAIVLEDNGFPGILAWRYENKLDYINSVILNQFFYRNANAYKNFKAGMNSLGSLWDVIEPFPNWQLKILSDAGDKLTADKLIKLINYNYSEHGVLNHFEREEETAFTFHMYLRALEDVEDETDDEDMDEDSPGRKISNVTLPKLLFWLTGSDEIPVFGFKESIDVVWFEREDTKHFPQASTCGFKLHLPRGESDLSQFEPYMNEAIKLSFNYFGLI